MSTTSSRSPAETTGQREKNLIAGAATIQPGTFREPDQPGASRTTSLFDLLETAPAAVIDRIRKYPVPAFFLGIGLGVALARFACWARSERATSKSLARFRGQD